MCPAWSNVYWWCQFLEYNLLFASWWVPPAVIVTSRKCQMLMTGSFPHSVPFTGSVSTWHTQITHHIFLGLYCFWMYHHSGRMSPPQVVYVLGVVAPSFLNVTILHRRWLGFWGNCLYSGGYCSLINSIYLSIFQNLSTLGGALSETSWVRFYHRPLHRSCWAKHMSWMCILLS